MWPGFGIRPSAVFVPALSVLLAACDSSDGLNNLVRQPAPDGIHFSANNGREGAELWYSDGTNAGTTQVRDINGSGGSDIRNVVIIQ